MAVTMKFLAATSAAILAANSIAAAQEADGDQPTPTPPPPCESEEYRQFDFWLGEWEVTGANGAKAGENVITAEENGCLIVERWTSAGGGTGQSYTFYDPGLKKWRQVWVSGAATIDYAVGLNDAGDMALEGSIHYRNGSTFPFRGIWTPNDDGTVRQHFDQFDPETDEWKPWFTGIY